MMNKTTRFTTNAATVMAIAGTVIGIMGMGLTLVACGSYDKKEEVANVTEDENTEPTIIVDDEISTGLNESDIYKSFLGLHVSSYDGSDIMVEEDGENGRLKVNVGIFRVCTIDDGVGVFENDTVSFSADDPNGNKIRCCLYYDGDNSLCLEVVDSVWDVLPAGTVISGFDK